MKVGGRFHLTYCSNIHAGETWEAVDAALRASLPQIRVLTGAAGPFGIGLRLSAAAAASLDQAAALERFREFLSDGNYYVPTINGFPYGAFHGERVKERVYLPDWCDPKRLAYTNRLAGLLAALNADRVDVQGSVSTVPGAFRSNVTTEADREAIAMNILRHAAYLVELRERTGVTVTLAIEPEPACFIETVADAVQFFQRYLFDAPLIARTAADMHAPLGPDEVRRHIGLCFDACHMAVEFEQPAEALDVLADAGVRIYKVQISSALQLDDLDGTALRTALAPFAEDTYLHQVVERRDSELRRFVDLPEALADAAGDLELKRDWRVHFHVPIFLERMHGFGTTQPYLVEVLNLLKERDVCSCLEVETYTWDVLPEAYRTTDLCTAIARELTWARTRLES